MYTEICPPHSLDFGPDGFQTIGGHVDGPDFVAFVEGKTRHDHVDAVSHVFENKSRLVLKKKEK